VNNEAEWSLSLYPDITSIDSIDDKISNSVQEMLHGDIQKSKQPQFYSLGNIEIKKHFRC